MYGEGESGIGSSESMLRRAAERMVAVVMGVSRARPRGRLHCAE